MNETKKTADRASNVEEAIRREIEVTNKRIAQAERRIVEEGRDFAEKMASSSGASDPHCVEAWLRTAQTEVIEYRQRIERLEARKSGLELALLAVNCNEA